MFVRRKWIYIGRLAPVALSNDCNGFVVKKMQAVLFQPEFRSVVVTRSRVEIDQHITSFDLI